MGVYPPAFLECMRTSVSNLVQHGRFSRIRSIFRMEKSHTMTFPGGGPTPRSPSGGREGSIPGVVWVCCLSPFYSFPPIPIGGSAKVAFAKANATLAPAAPFPFIPMLFLSFLRIPFHSFPFLYLFLFLPFPVPVAVPVTSYQFLFLFLFLILVLSSSCSLTFPFVCILFLPNAIFFLFFSLSLSVNFVSLFGGSA